MSEHAEPAPSADSGSEPSGTDSSTAQPQAPTQDAPAPEADPVARAYAQLARREKELLDQRKQLLTESSGIKELRQNFNRVKAIAEQDPVQAVQMLSQIAGVQGDLWERANRAVLGEPEDEVSVLKRELSELKGQLSEFTSRSQQSDVARQQAEVLREISTFVDSGGDKYAAMRAWWGNEVPSRVFQQIKDHYDDTARVAVERGYGAPVILTYEQASDILEEQLRERGKGLLPLYATSSENQSPHEGGEPVAMPPAAHAEPKTLTNAGGSAVSSRLSSGGIPDEAERIRRAKLVLGES